MVARNWKGFGGEVDLIAYDGPFLVFVEVKTRRGPVTRAPEERVDWKKERKLDELAFDFLVSHEISETPVRLGCDSGRNHGSEGIRSAPLQERMRTNPKFQISNHKQIPNFKFQITNKFV